MPASRDQADFDEQALINPFSIAAREQNDNEKEQTAEGFFKNRDENSSILKNTSSFLTKDLDLEDHPIEAKHVNGKRVSPFDVLQQHQIEA